jgi:hypothetical protein
LSYGDESFPTGLFDVTSTKNPLFRPYALDRSGDGAKRDMYSPTPETCGQCNVDRVEQFKKGKHAIAWAAMEAMPTIHYRPIAMTVTEGMKGCGGCHKIGLKTPEQIATLAKTGIRFGNPPKGSREADGREHTGVSDFLTAYFLS